MKIEPPESYDVADESKVKSVSREFLPDVNSHHSNSPDIQMVFEQKKYSSQQNLDLPDNWSYIHLC